MRISGVTCAAAFVLVVGCGSGSSSPPPASPGEPASSSEPAAAGSSAPEGAAPAPESSGAAKAASAPASESESLARDIVKSGGRRIGYSATKKSWVHPQSRRTGESTSLDVVFTDEEGRPKDVMRICQAGECDEH